MSKLGDLSDLPQALLDELTGINTLEEQIIAVINFHGGVASLDQILVGLYRKFEVLQKRRFVQQRMWRIQKNEEVWPVAGRRGVYTTTRPLVRESVG